MALKNAWINSANQYSDKNVILSWEECYLVQARIALLFSRHQNDLESLLKCRLLSPFSELLLSTYGVGPKILHFWVSSCCCWYENNILKYYARILGASIQRFMGIRLDLPLFQWCLRFILYSKDEQYIYLEKAWLASCLDFTLCVCLSRLLKHRFGYGLSDWL